jgi:hypothetical protein
VDELAIDGDIAKRLHRQYSAAAGAGRRPIYRDAASLMAKRHGTVDLSKKWRPDRARPVVTEAGVRWS